MIKALTPRQKFQKLMTEIGGGWYMGEIAKAIPPLRRSKLSKKSQDREDKIENIYGANKWWNDWKPQLRLHKLEWVNPIRKIKIKKAYSFYIKKA